MPRDQRVIEIRPERPAEEWDMSTLVLKYDADPQGWRLFHYHFGPQGTYMATCVLWIPDELGQRPEVRSRLEELKLHGTVEESTFINGRTGVRMPFPLTKLWLRDTVEVRELVDILRAAVSGHRESQLRRNPWPEHWPTFENPVGVFS
jgi:hypothetical protein